MSFGAPSVVFSLSCSVHLERPFFVTEHDCSLILILLMHGLVGLVRFGLNLVVGLVLGGFLRAGARKVCIDSLRLVVYLVVVLILIRLGLLTKLLFLV